MSRIRITCKAPEPIKHHLAGGRVVGINSMPATWGDIEVTLVSPDGSEHAITNVTGVVWRCAQDNEPATATLEFLDADIDVEAEADLPEEATS